MKLSDYLPYYIGCKMMFEKSGRIITLTGVNEMDVYDCDKWWDLSVWNFKPILRPLSDINITEFIPLMEMIVLTGQAYPERHYRLSLNDAGNPVLEIDNDWFDAKLVLGVKTGSIWRTDTTSANVKIPAAAFNHLRKCGFDCDGLIPNGLAIDTSTLTSKK